MGWRKVKVQLKYSPLLGAYERFCEHCDRPIDGSVCEVETGRAETHFMRCGERELCETCYELLICPVCGEDGTCEHREA